jgi:hypothetical protein
MQAITELLLQLALIIYILDFIVFESFSLVRYLLKTIKDHYAPY